MNGAFAAAPAELGGLAGRLRAAAGGLWALRERVAAVDVAAGRPLSPATFEVVRARLREAVEALDQAERGAVDLADRLAENARSYAEADGAAATRLLEVDAPPTGAGAAQGAPASSRGAAPAFELPAGRDGPVTIRPVGRGVRIATAAAPVGAAAIVARAKRWADLGLGYSMTGFHDGYRTDCSGLVSMAWGLPRPGLTTVTLPGVSHPIDKEELRPGDILLNRRPGAIGHTLIFAGWADAAHSRYHAYEESASRGAHLDTVPYPYWPGHGTFLPYRLDAGRTR